MPQSFVLNLVTQSAIPWQHLQGHALQQLFFNLVDTVDPALGNVLRLDKQNRSYSLSALQREEAFKPTSPRATELSAQFKSQQPQQAQVEPVLPAQSNIQLLASKRQLSDRPFRAQSARLQHSHQQAIKANTPCWWRISFLDDDLFDHLIILWNQLTGEPFMLGTGSLAISSISADLPGSAWASSCSYRDIYEQASSRDRDIHLQFITPTAFENDGHATPLPTAESVFHTLRKRWNHYSGLAFAPSLVSNIVPAHFDIKTGSTQRLDSKAHESIVGCTGQISFRIDGDRDPLIIKRINTLADFTRYCGVGCHTRLGMGIIRRLSSPVALSCHLHTN